MTKGKKCPEPKLIIIYNNTLPISPDGIWPKVGLLLADILACAIKNTLVKSETAQDNR